MSLQQQSLFRLTLFVNSNSFSVFEATNGKLFVISKNLHLLLLVNKLDMPIAYDLIFDFHKFPLLEYVEKGVLCELGQCHFSTSSDSFGRKMVMIGVHRELLQKFKHSCRCYKLNCR